MKPTLKDIAARAGVGIATVERVLNGRGMVRAETAEKVIAAARALGTQRRMPEMHHGIFRIEVLLLRPENTFYDRLSKAFERVAATLDSGIQIQRTYVDHDNPAEMVRRILHPAARRSGLVLAIPDHLAVRAALREIGATGLPMVHVVTRVGGNDGHFIGIDNLAAGRTAAMFIARMQRRPGPVLAIGDPIYHVHRERLAGFSDYFDARPGSGLDFVQVAFGRDDPARINAAVRAALRDYPDLAAIYNVGAANSAVEAALVQARRAGEIFFVGHELTANSAAALRNGHMHIVIDQSPEAQARRAVDWLLFRLGLSEVAPDPTPIRFITHTDQSV